ncbi:peptidylprolyl isomerase [bacterium C-53]|nr:peptidylprolyl isomerase [Lachnospiraceae bacterium]RKJ11613.1 peptidylprolyl isomerase [bacterium C-53]
MRFGKKRCMFLLLVILAGISIAGCTKTQEEEKTEIVLTTDFKENEVFRINTESCTTPEMMVYMSTLQAQYESVFGREIWEKDLGGFTLEQQLKDTILARLAQIKVMNLLAKNYGVTLSEEENALIEKAAAEYLSKLKPGEISAMGVTEEMIEMLYREYAIANKVYSEITKDINPEISDDEARNISVKHILIKTYSLDEKGEKVEYTERQKEDAHKRIREIQKKIRNGEDFDSLVEEYNEDDKSVHIFGKGTMPKEFEEASFNLDTDQISGIVETEYGYHIIKCISTFDRDETDQNKVKIVEERKNEAFNQVYVEFVKGLYSNLNRKLWDSLTFEDNPDCTSTNFFDVYNTYF